MLNVLLVAIGGFFGAISRFYIGTYFKKRTVNFPLGTLIVNLTGSFFLGILLGYGVAGQVYHFAGIGFLGAFTTFSTLNIEIIQLVLKGHWRQVSSYVIFTYIGGIILAFLGILLSRTIN